MRDLQTNEALAAHTSGSLARMVRVMPLSLKIYWTMLVLPEAEPKVSAHSI